MNTNRDLNYRLFLHREEGFKRTSFNTEFSRYSDVSMGNVEKVKQNFIEIKNNFLEGKGILSDDHVRNVRYHIIIATAMISRACVEAGMPHDTAYTLSDIYIQRCDICDTADGLIEILGFMEMDFAERMRDIKKNAAVSIHIRKCIEYMYDHLQEKITVYSVAQYLKINPTYLSKLFVKETGTCFKAYLINIRIDVAKNMLKYSDYSYLDISLSLGFSSQSAFISVFKKVTGMTPGRYRKEYC
ncbi:MAG: AraC family transcriptional regulator [Clostridiales bacterium]|nr:AraC family transcriptional regulator [Clostridiales bacterium]